MSSDSAKLPAVDNADVVWAEGRLRSQRFQDGYFSDMDGLAETQHVFLTGNNLPQRWVGASNFIVAELGFGTGLNFLATWRAFRQTNPLGVLQFVSFEKYLLTATEIERALTPWQELARFQAPLLAALPAPAETGFITLQFPQAELTLGLGDARTLLPAWDEAADAWFLDGFNPAHNPELWEPALLQEVYDHTQPAGTLATYTAAGHVRRALQTAGFDIRKVKGFASKREMVVGKKGAL